MPLQVTGAYLADIVDFANGKFDELSIVLPWLVLFWYRGTSKVRSRYQRQLPATPCRLLNSRH